MVDKSHFETKAKQGKLPSCDYSKEDDFEQVWHHSTRRIKGATAMSPGTRSIHNHSSDSAKALPNDMSNFNDREQLVKRKREDWAGPGPAHYNNDKTSKAVKPFQQPSKILFFLLHQAYNI